MKQYFLNMNQKKMGLGLALLLTLPLFGMGRGSTLHAAELDPGYTIGKLVLYVSERASQGGDFSVVGTVGQAGTVQVRGGEFTASGGYSNVQFHAGTPPSLTLFLPVVSR